MLILDVGYLSTVILRVLDKRDESAWGHYGMDRCMQVSRRRGRCVRSSQRVDIERQKFLIVTTIAFTYYLHTLAFPE